MGIGSGTVSRGTRPSGFLLAAYQTGTRLIGLSD